MSGSVLVSRLAAQQELDLANTVQSANLIKQRDVLGQGR